MEILARAVGRRKEAVAQVQLVRGTGQFIINNKLAQTYLQNNSCSLICIKSPIQAAFGEKSQQNSQILTLTESQTDLGLTLLPLSSDKDIKNNNLKKQQTETPGFFLNFFNASCDSKTSFDGIALLPSSEKEKGIDIIVKVKGGGLIGQAEAIKLGLARAFCIVENLYGETGLRKILKTKGYLTQDSRVKERRKYGLKKARKASQYHKR